MRTPSTVCGPRPVGWANTAERALLFVRRHAVLYALDASASRKELLVDWMDPFITSWKYTGAAFRRHIATGLIANFDGNCTLGIKK